jgi:hypothetical protein
MERAVIFSSVKSSRALISLILVLAGAAYSAWTPKEQLNAIARETQKSGNRAGRFTLVWWMPPEFWRITLLASADVPAKKIEETVSGLNGANVFLVADGKIGTPGTIDYTSPEDLQKNLSIIDPQGQKLELIPEDKQTAAVKNVLSLLGPVLRNMLGDVGTHMSFFIFADNTKDLKDHTRGIDPTKPGVLTARLGGEEFRWRLPLGSLRPPKVCPKCHESFPGNYSFCPFDATPLPETENQKE